jgi:hypothetical protein
MLGGLVGWYVKRSLTCRTAECIYFVQRERLPSSLFSLCVIVSVSVCGRAAEEDAGGGCREDRMEGALRYRAGDCGLRRRGCWRGAWWCAIVAVKPRQKRGCCGQAAVDWKSRSPPACPECNDTGMVGGSICTRCNGNWSHRPCPCRCSTITCHFATPKPFLLLQEGTQPASWFTLKEP